MARHQISSASTRAKLDIVYAKALRKLVERCTVKVGFASSLQECDEILEDFAGEVVALYASRPLQPNGSK